MLLHYYIRSSVCCSWNIIQYPLTVKMYSPDSSILYSWHNLIMAQSIIFWKYDVWVRLGLFKIKKNMFEQHVNDLIIINHAPQLYLWGGGGGGGGVYCFRVHPYVHPSVHYILVLAGYLISTAYWGFLVKTDLALVKHGFQQLHWRLSNSTCFNRESPE